MCNSQVLEWQLQRLGQNYQGLKNDVLYWHTHSAENVQTSAGQEVNVTLEMK